MRSEKQHGWRRHRLCWAVVATVLFGTPAASAQARLKVDEALKLAFPDAEVRRTSVVLDDRQRAAVREAAGTALRSKLVFPYVAEREGRLVGTAYFDAHRVRTKREVLMVVVTPAHTIARIEVVAFAEPAEYLPAKPFYSQFVGAKLGPELSLKRGIRGVAGATLTSRATLEAARRVLALHRVLAGEPPEPGGGEGGPDRSRPESGGKAQR